MSFGMSKSYQTTSDLISGVYKDSNQIAANQQFGIVTSDEQDLDFVACKSCYTSIRYIGHQSDNIHNKIGWWLVMFLMMGALS